MPHFGLMDEKELGPVKGPLLRAQLHIRCGKRRLREGKIAAGIVTLYDALEGAMRSYIGDPDHRALLYNRHDEDLNKESMLYAALVRSHVLDGAFDFESFDRLTERALLEEMPGYEYRQLLTDFDDVMVQLGVMPFDETSLPPEDPKTF
jgi:hypothetical protein